MPPATQAELNNPQGVAVDSDGDVYIQDSGNGVIRKVTTGGILNTLASAIYSGTSPALAIDAAGDLFAPGSATTIIRVTPDGQVHPFASLPSDHMTEHYGLANDVRGGLVAYGIYQTDSNPVLAHISSSGVPTAYYTSALQRPGCCRRHRYGSSRRCFHWIRVRRLLDPTPWYGQCSAFRELTALACGYNGDVGPASGATLNNPVGVAFDSNGWLYVADSGNNAIRVIYPDAIFTQGFEQ